MNLFPSRCHNQRRQHKLLPPAPPRPPGRAVSDPSRGQGTQHPLARFLFFQSTRFLVAVPAPLVGVLCLSLRLFRPRASQVPNSALTQPAYIVSLLVCVTKGPPRVGWKQANGRVIAQAFKRQASNVKGAANPRSLETKHWFQNKSDFRPPVHAFPKSQAGRGQGQGLDTAARHRVTSGYQPPRTHHISNSTTQGFKSKVKGHTNSISYVAMHACMMSINKTASPSAHPSVPSHPSIHPFAPRESVLLCLQALSLTTVAARKKPVMNLVMFSTACLKKTRQNPE